MSGGYLRDYMAKLVDSSAGAFATGSTMRWSHFQLPTSSRVISSWRGPARVATVRYTSSSTPSRRPVISHGQRFRTRV